MSDRKKRKKLDKDTLEQILKDIEQRIKHLEELRKEKIILLTSI